MGFNIDDLFENHEGEFESKTDTPTGKERKDYPPDEDSLSLLVLGIPTKRADEMFDEVRDAMVEHMRTSTQWHTSLIPLLNKYEDPKEKQWACFVIGSVMAQIRMQEERRSNPLQGLMDMLGRLGDD
jgi:hypothetical protein